MAADPRVLALLEEMLDARKTPEEVCRGCPELLAEDREGWREFRFIDAKSEVSPNTVAGAFLNGEPLPEEAEEVDGEAWLGSRAGRVAESLYEVAIPLGRYGQVISLIWPA